MDRMLESFEIGGVQSPNRLLLAPLAGIGNWFVRLQAKRYGAGLTVSEMVSSHGLAYGDKRTRTEFLRLHPDEGPTSVQLFGADPAIMREAAAIVAESGASLIDLNMGCPVKKVCRTGAGSAMLRDPDTAVAVAVAAREGGLRALGALPHQLALHRREPHRRPLLPGQVVQDAEHPPPHQHPGHRIDTECVQRVDHLSRPRRPRDVDQPPAGTGPRQRGQATQRQRRRP